MTANRAKLQSVEIIVSNLLRYGVLICGLTIATGWIARLLHLSNDTESSEQTIAKLLQGERLVGNYLPQNAGDFWEGVVSLQADAVMAAGLVLLILLPVMRVGTTLLLFLIERDWLFSIISFFVLTMLMISLVWGHEL